MRKVVEPGDLVQVNEDGPHNWFRVILVVDEVKPWGVQAYATVPQERGRPTGDAYMRLEWQEFDPIGAKSLFVTQSIKDELEKADGADL